jgi:hypothetical protein
MSEFIERVQQPPKTRSTSEVYDRVIEAVAKETAGWFKVSIPNKKPISIYQQLAKKLKKKGRKDLKLHKIKDANKKDVVYLEKTAVEK